MTSANLSPPRPANIKTPQDSEKATAVSEEDPKKNATRGSSEALRLRDSGSRIYQNVPENEDEEESDERQEITETQNAFLTKLHKHAHELFPESADEEENMAKLKDFIKQQPDETKSRLGELGASSRTILHAIFLQGSAKFKKGSRYLFIWAMEEHPNLYKTLFKGESVLRIAARKPYLLQDFVYSYPQQAAVLLENARDGNKLLRQIMPFVNHCAVAEFMGFFDNNVNSIVHQHEHVCCCAKYSPSGSSEATSATGIQISPTPVVSGTLGDMKQRLEVNEDKNTVLHLAAQYNESSIISQLEMVKKVFEWCPEAIEKTNKAGHSPYKHCLHTYVEYAASENEKGNAVPPQNDIIANFLKGKIMRLMDSDLILRLLHGEHGAGPGTEREIHLDLCEIQNTGYTVSKDEFGKFLNSLEFENILQYVQIPPHPFSSESNTTASEGVAVADSEKAAAGDGRQDFKFIFDLLKTKGVKKIVRLIVEDDDLYPHRDDVIEELKYFEIEEWDWDKIDLSSMVLKEAVPLARKIHLWSSGNHSVLRDWSGCGGLNQLTHLESVRVTIRWRVESKLRAENYANDFKNRIAINCPQLVGKIVVKVEKMSSRSNTNVVPGRDKMTANTWLGNMTKFVEFIVNVPKDVKPRTEVRVAIIDDGIDLIQAGLDQCIGRSFYTEPRQEFTRTNPHYFSSTGHGTLMAALVQKVCPKAVFYVARLHQGHSSTGTPQPTADSAAKAIRWAIQQKVHIISMSWTIPGEKHLDLEAAIKEAKKEKILMFGSASDQGRNNLLTPYPANCKEHGVICIGAARETGFAEEGAEKEADYFFPGGIRGIQPPLPQVKSDEKPQPVSGSSVATALATGLTALIIYCVEISEYGSPECEHDYRDSLQDYTMIKNIFTDLARDEGGKFIPVQNFFKAKLADEFWAVNGKTELNKAVGRIIRRCIDAKEGTV